MVAGWSPGWAVSAGGCGSVPRWWSWLIPRDRPQARLPARARL